MKKTINLIDVTARDGLQNLKKILTTNQKIELVDRLTDCGYNHIEVGSYVTPKLLQMKDSLQVHQKIRRQNNIKYTMLVPSSQKFIEMDNNIQKNVFPNSISTITTISETFANKNMKMTISDSIDNIHSIAQMKHKYNFWLRTYISCCFGCPYEEQIDKRVLYRILLTLPIEVDEIIISDTIGKFDENSLNGILSSLKEQFNMNKFGLHVHCTNDKIPTLFSVALKYGINNYDVSLSQLGGCPYANKDINYNMSALETVKYLNKIGYETGINETKLVETENWLNSVIKE